MLTTHSRLALAAIALLAPALAGAQLYKCKDANGRTVYSDSRCEAAATGSLKVTPNSSTLSEREKADLAAREAQQAEAGKAPAAPAAPAAGPAGSRPGRYQLTSSDKDRIRDLEVSQGRLGASSEQKAAASLELSSIRSGQDARMSAEQRSRRDAMHTDLVSADAKKRKDTLNALRTLYSEF